MLLLLHLFIWREQKMLWILCIQEVDNDNFDWRYDIYEWCSEGLNERNVSLGAHGKRVQCFQMSVFKYILHPHQQHKE